MIDFFNNCLDLGVYYAPPYLSRPGDYGGPPTIGGPAIGKRIDHGEDSPYISKKPIETPNHESRCKYWEDR